MTMCSKSPLTLILSVLLVLEVLHIAHCCSIGQLCNRSIPNQCDPGLICAADNARPSITYCQHAANSEPCDLSSCPSVWCGPDLQYTPEGQCCPLCPPEPTAVLHLSGCTEEDGQHYNEGETWKRDPCTTCNCIDGFSLCSAISCAPLTCQNYVQHSHRCCPTCIETTVAFPPAPSSDCRVGDIVYRDGETWRPDSTQPCKRAVCDEGEIFFSSHQCAAPECENAIYSEDTCCPICPEEEITPSLDTLPSRTECNYNGITLEEGETHCPAPNTTITCHQGELEYSSHCDPVPCSNPIEGVNPCDCPYCPENMYDFVVGGHLDMPVYRYALQASQIDSMLDTLVMEAGLTPKYNSFSQCNFKICIELHVLTSDASATEDGVVEAVRTELDSQKHKGLSIGHVGDFNTERRSVRSADFVRSVDYDSLTIQSSSNQHGSATATVIAVVASVCGVLASVIGVALIASFVHRKQKSQTTIIV